MQQSEVKYAGGQSVPGFLDHGHPVLADAQAAQQVGVRAVADAPLQGVRAAVGSARTGFRAAWETWDRYLQGVRAAVGSPFGAGRPPSASR